MIPAHHSQCFGSIYPYITFVILFYVVKTIFSSFLKWQYRAGAGAGAKIREKRGAGAGAEIK